MPISKFKATCLAALERVRKTGKPLRVTRFGKPIADIVPSLPDPPNKSWLGGLSGSIRIVGDITAPVVDEDEWDVFR